jgi:hypothetical protein
MRGGSGTTTGGLNVGGGSVTGGVVGKTLTPVLVLVLDVVDIPVVGADAAWTALVCVTWASAKQTPKAPSVKMTGSKLLFFAITLAEKVHKHGQYTKSAVLMSFLPNKLGSLVNFRCGPEIRQ